MTAQDNDDRSNLLHLALDGELDAARTIQVERQLAIDPGLAAEHARLVALRGAIRAAAPHMAAPENLRRRILAESEREISKMAGTELSQNPRLRWSVRVMVGSLAASLVVAAGLAAFLASTFVGPKNETMKALVASHMRSQISGRPVDVASNDRHSVKPWLAAKLPVAAVVMDLSQDGFPLMGGRIDIVDGVAAPTLVYGRREHLVSMTEMPPKAGEAPQAPKFGAMQGYTTARWTDGAHVFVAISDLAPVELEAFTASFRAAARKEREVIVQ
jgi:anti-sigma factor RsiW